MKDRRFRIYLAGPIGGCNTNQQVGWRQQVREHWKDEFEFIDPTETPISSPDTCLAYEIVEKDQRAIEAADGVLANMWRESIGTAIGVVHANTKGRPVVVVDPNWIDNRILAFYADAVERTTHDAMHTMRDLLRTQHSFKVHKVGGKEEPFSRKKIVASLRGACRAAEVNDIVGPAIVLPRVLKAITAEGRKVGGTITTGDIRATVMSSLEALENDPVHAAAVRGVREAWGKFLEETRRSPLDRSHPTASVVSEKGDSLRPLEVPVRSGKSHSTIWGKTVKSLQDIPAPAQGLLRRITCVDGIAEIRLTTMSKGPKSLAGRVKLQTSTTSGIIEGQLYDLGTKGEVQSFQIRLHDPRRTADVLRELTEIFQRADALG